MANNQGDQKNKKNAPAFNDMILGNLKSRSGKDTTKWLSNLSSDNEDEIESAAPAASTPAPQAQAYTLAAAQEHIKWVDKLFDLLQQYEAEFNRVAPSQDLAVRTDRAIVTSDLVSRMKGNDQIHFHGRLYTRYWTMILVGNLYYLEGFIIPSDHYIGFEANHSSYTQFFEANASWDGELKWTCDDAVVNQGLLPAFAKQLFGQLIKVAKGEASDEERFQLGPSKKKTKNQNEGDAPSFLNRGNVFDDGAFLQNQPQTNSVPSTPLKAGRQTGSHRKEFPSGKNNYSQASNQSEFLVGSESSTQSSTTAKSSAQISQQDLTNLAPEQACDVLLAAVDRQLAQLSKAGASAFESHNFSEAEKLLKKTAQMKEFREQVAKALDDWKRILKDELA